MNSVPVITMNELADKELQMITFRTPPLLYRPRPRYGVVGDIQAAVRAVFQERVVVPSSPPVGRACFCGYLVDAVRYCFEDISADFVGR